MNKKRGITVTSLVIYVVLFFMFSFLVTTVTANINKTMFVKRGKIYNVKNTSKLNSYLVTSAKKSDDVYKIDDRLIFNNNDEYVFDSNKKCILKNDKIIVKGVTKFNSTVESTHNNIKQVGVEVEFEKYLVKRQEKYIFAVRGGV